MIRLNTIGPDEVELTQYLRPNGRQRTVATKVGEEYAQRAEGMILSCEVLTTGMVAVYGRLEGESEEDEVLKLTLNGPSHDGTKEPSDIVKEIIDELDQRRSK